MRDGMGHEYDYENRIVKITRDGNDIAEFAYDALGRRIKKVDSAAGTTNIYYYNDKWQVLCDYNDANDLQMWFTYGNYIDEVLTANEGLRSCKTKMFSFITNCYYSTYNGTVVMLTL